MYLRIVLTDGLFGRPTFWPHVVDKLTKHSRTRDWQRPGRFQPLNGAVSAGDRLALRRGEFGVPITLCDKCTVWLLLLLMRFKFCTDPVSDFKRMRRPINGVCDTSNVKSIVLPANSYEKSNSYHVTIRFFRWRVGCVNDIYLFAKYFGIAETAVIMVWRATGWSLRHHLQRWTTRHNQLQYF